MNFPFAAVAGQSSYKLALILASIDPAIGGVLVSGPRGSAKSTLARGMADIMPTNDPIDNPSSARFVTLPLGATTDRVVGTLSLEHVLSEQRVQFQPGLLARADNGVLYVDEVNLLPDHLVDLLLDVSVSGVNVIERDGLSHQHPARFVLLGTMNPDEGELRPQLQDRFGLAVQLSNHYSVSERMEIVRLREAFDNDPAAFVQQHTLQQQQLTKDIALARSLLSAVTCNAALRQGIAEQCMRANVDGLRADIVWLKAATALAAYRAHSSVQPEDIDAVAELVLAHRRNPPPSDANQSGGEPTGRSQQSTPSYGSEDEQSSPNAESGSPSSDTRTDHPGVPQGSEADWGQMPPQVQVSVATDQAMPVSAMMQSLQTARPVSGSQHPIQEFVSTTPGTHTNGNHARQRVSTSVNWFTTLLSNAGQWPLRTLRYRRAQTGDSALHLVLLDTSASTLQSRWFAKAKAAVLQIAAQVYLAREQLAIMGFGNEQVELLYAQKRAPKSLQHWLDTVPAAGGTPMRAIIDQALQYQKNQRRRNPGIVLKTYLITDGRTSQTFDGLHLLGNVLVIDIEQSAIRRGRAAELSNLLGATYWQLPA